MNKIEVSTDLEQHAEVFYYSVYEDRGEDPQGEDVRWLIGSFSIHYQDKVFDKVSYTFKKEHSNYSREQWAMMPIINEKIELINKQFQDRAMLPMLGNPYSKQWSQALECICESKENEPGEGIFPGSHSCDRCHNIFTYTELIEENGGLLCNECKIKIT